MLLGPQWANRVRLSEARDSDLNHRINTSPLTANLVQWHKSSHLIGTYSDGDNVTSWPGQGSEGINLTPDAGEEPVFKEGILNGHPAVRFSGAQAVYGSTTVLDGWPFTIYVVTDYHTGKNAITACWTDNSSDDNYYVLGIRDPDADGTYETALSTRPGGTGPTHTWAGDVSDALANTYVATAQFGYPPQGRKFAVYEGGEIRGGLDDHFGSESAVANTSAFALGGLVRNGGLNGDELDGDVFEVLTYTAYHDPHERAYMAHYLASEYGI